MNDQFDQTQFSTEQPFWQSPVDVPQEEVVAKEKVPFIKRRKLVIVTIAGVTLLFVLLLSFIAQVIEKNKRVTVPPTPLSTPAPAYDMSELLTRQDNLTQQLRAADPSKQELTTPSVNYEIRLDEKPR